MTKKTRKKVIDLVDRFVKIGLKRGADYEQILMACLTIIDQGRKDGIRVLGMEIPKVDE